MPELKDLLKKLRPQHGTQVEVAEKLGIKSQQLSQYEGGTRNPKVGFYRKWKTQFNEDLQAMMDETNVSHETKKHTHGQNEPAVTEKTLGEMEAFKKIVEGDTEYLLIPRAALEGKYRLVALEQLSINEKELERKNDELIRKDHQIIGLYELVKLIASGRTAELPKMQETKQNAGV